MKRFATLLVTTLVMLSAFKGADVSALPNDEGQEGVNAAETVVLLHGLGRSARHLWVLERRLEKKGFRVCNLDYQTRVDRIEEAIDEVLSEMLECTRGDDLVHFVTHSLGGLVLRGLVARPGLPRLGRAVMLAPPNQGSEVADRIRDWGSVSAVMGRLAGQLGTRPNDLPQRLPAPSIPFGVIAGDRSLSPSGGLWLPKPHDGRVSVESTRLAGMRDHIVLPHTHTFIMNSTRVADEVDMFLRHGHFTESPSE